MKKSTVSISILVASLIFAEEDVCKYRCAKPHRVAVRHIECNGIGYNQGYSTLDLFFSQRYGAKTPFVDLRGHVFNDGRFAANGGVGYRQLWRSVILGGNLYYDYRNTTHTHYNQIGFGFEALAKRWDARLNGYLPLGKKNSDWYGASYGGFSGHSLLVKRKQEFAMGGANAEGGWYSDSACSYWVYGGIGPYYLRGKETNVYGGQARFNANYKTYVELELSASYDNVFHDIYQVQLAFSFPFGSREGEEKKPACCPWNQERFVQPVRRFEIVPADTRSADFKAIDPSTGRPYYFLFVNNTSSSLGTFESPYPDFNDALNVSNDSDIFYIYPGDGTATGLTTSEGYTLLNNQQLLGAGYSYLFPTTFGAVTIPPLALGQPYFVGDTSSDYVFYAANNNTFAGLHMETDADGGTCISSLGNVVDMTVINNLIEPLGSNEGAAAIEPITAQGLFIITNNTVNSQGLETLAVNLNSSGGLVAEIVNNAFDSSDAVITSDDTVCLRFQNNSTTGEYAFTNAGVTFDLEPFTGNTPDMYQSMGTITPVPQGTCQ